jgi:TRAP transporter TAXI family solute receptor
MKFLAKSMLLLVFFVSAVVAKESCVPEETHITITTGSKSGVYYKIGNDIKTLVESKCTNIKINVILSNGSLLNMTRLLNNGQPPCQVGVQNEKTNKNCSADIGIVQSDVWVEKYDDNLGLLVILYKEEVHLFARTDITKMDDLEKTKVVIGLPNTGTNFTAKKILTANNISSITKINDETPDDAIYKVFTEEVDAVFYVVGQGAKAFTQFENIPYYRVFGKLEGIHFVPIKNNDKKHYYSSYIMKKSYNWLHKNDQNEKIETIETIAVKAMLIGRKNDKHCNAILEIGNIIQSDILATDNDNDNDQGQKKDKGLKKDKKYATEKWNEIDLEELNSRTDLLKCD